MAHDLVTAFCGETPFGVLKDVDENCRHSGADFEGDEDEAAADTAATDERRRLRSGFHAVTIERHPPTKSKHGPRRRPSRTAKAS